VSSGQDLTIKTSKLRGPVEDIPGLSSYLAGLYLPLAGGTIEGDLVIGSGAGLYLYDPSAEADVQLSVDDGYLLVGTTPLLSNDSTLDASKLGVGEVPIDRIPTGATSLTVCIGNDSRLSDARTPLAHNQAWSTITSTPTTVAGYGISDAVTLSGTQTISNKTFTTVTTTGISSFDKTRTSATNFETLTIDPITDASNYRIGSRVGSAGGTTRGVVIGSYNSAGAWTQWVAFDSTGLQVLGAGRNITSSGAAFITFGGAGFFQSSYNINDGSMGLISVKLQTANSSTQGNIGAILQATTNTLVIRNAANSAAGDATLANLVASGTIVNTPSSSAPTLPDRPATVTRKHFPPRLPMSFDIIQTFKTEN